jgi:exosome complex component RRP45
MAIREEHDFLSESERAFLFHSIHDKPHVRADGRELMQQRKVRSQSRRFPAINRLSNPLIFLASLQIRVQFRRSDDQSQAEVQLGRTRCVSPRTLHIRVTLVRVLIPSLLCSVIANVHGEIVPPFPDRPTEGFLQFNVELSPMASQNFENSGRPTPLAVELARIVDRGIRECRALDTEALAIVAGEKVWAITCDIHVVDHGGNLIDAVSLAAIAALMHYRRPEVSVQSGGQTTVYKMDDHAAVPLSLHHIPISISFCFVESTGKDTVDADDAPIVFMDPTDREERITDGSMTFTFNSFRELCAVHKIGGAAIATTDVLRCANIAAARVAELTEFLQEEAEKADKVAVEKRRATLRGREFQDVSSLTDQEIKQHRAQVDLGIMTDFKTLHAPIALRDDPTQAETDASVSSMAQLLASLEQAADDVRDAPPASGLEMSNDAAREAFQKLAAGFNMRELVAGATEAKPSVPKAPQSGKPSTVVTKISGKKKAKPVDSDSEEESVVVQSEFTGGADTAPVETTTTPTKALTPASTTKKTPVKKATKKKAALSSDSDSDVDLSAAVKRKPGKK